MNVQYSKNLSDAFVASSDSLKKLVELLQNYVGKVDISTDCADGFSRDFNTIEALIDYENPKSKEIRRIDLSARSDDYKTSASIDFNSSIFRRKISIHFEGCQEIVLKLRDETQIIIEGMRPWYNVVSRISNSEYAVVILVFSIYLVARLTNLWLSISDYEVELLDVIIIPLLFIILLIALFFGKRLFPSAVFTIGQGKSRFRTLEKVQWSVVIAFIVSFAAGLVVPIIVIIF
ncbi:MAG: hypothetical protein OXU23_13650 [Candidatus Poribacteria bacterium]|nr:hypothetical protein [Candidatus Poribacteria bacterium]MDE0466351.1 hypothetical protein [Candidatus Poribacteria bacterium]